MPIKINKLYSQFEHSQTIKIPLWHRLIGWYTSATYGLALLPRKPMVLLKTFWQAFTGRYLRVKRKTLRSVSLVVTYNCNLNCAHCNITLMKNPRKKVMTLRDYLDLDRQLDKIGFLNYVFTGGEPLIDSSLFKLIKTLNPQKRLIIIQTNGTLLNERLMKKIAQAKVDVLNVSIDTMHSQSLSGKSGIDFDWCNKILTIAKKYHLKIQFSYVVTKESFKNGELEKVLNYCFNRRVLTIGNLPIPLGNWQDHKKILLPKKMARFLRVLEKKTPYFRTDHVNNLRGWGCPAFKEKLYVTPYGDIMGCTFLPFSLGNIKKESLEKILMKRKQISYFDHYQPHCPPAEDKRVINALLRSSRKVRKQPVNLEEIQPFLPHE